MKLTQKQLKKIILSELAKLNNPEDQTKLKVAIQHIAAARDYCGQIFENSGDELFQTIEMILENTGKVLTAKRKGQTLSGDPARAIAKHSNSIKQDVD